MNSKHVSNPTSFLGCGIFAFDVGAWENDLAKNDAS